MSLTPGVRLGPYEIVAKLGEGGMGVVYLGRDTRLDRLAALKILPASVAADRDRVDRFAREAKTASALNHPNVATVYDVGEADGVQFIAMEYVEGQTLRTLAESRPLGMTEIVNITRQVAEALVAAHARNIAHRDIKPENIVVRPDGYVKVLDFGLAKLTGRDRDSDSNADLATTMATTPGLVVGTVYYMSPEQARGQHVDTRTDIFSLGVVLYELCVRRRPFQGATSMDVLASILHEDPAPIASVSAEVPADLSVIVAKALRKDREARYQSARDLLNDLVAIEPAGRTGTRAATTAIRREGTRRSGRVAFAAGAALLTVGTAIYFGSGFFVSPAIESIAVLPFANTATNPDVDYLVEGIADSIVSDLATAPELRIVSRSSASRFKDSKVDPGAAGRQLGVAAVLTGRVQAREDRLEIDLELVAVGDNRRLWGKHYNPPFRDLLAVRREIARNVSAELRQRLGRAGSAAIETEHTKSVDAYQAYLKGAFSFRKFTEAGLNEAISHFLEALKHDPEYALAHVGLAETYIALGADYLPPTEVMPKAAAHATKAAQLDPALPEAHTALGIVKLVYDWNWPEAERELGHDRALRTQTIDSFSCALHYSDPVGRNDDAIGALQSALPNDPTALPTNLELGCASYYGRHFDRAIRQYKETLTLYPDHPWLAFGLGRAYSQKQQYADAIGLLTRMKDVSGDWPPIVAELAYAHARSGNAAQARKLQDELTEAATKRFIDPYVLASVSIGLGDKDEALKRLNAAVAVRSGWLPWLKVEPRWDPIRSDPRFVALLKRVGLEV
jgi:serine/threonine protein kinase/Tfp pilus assembly protein PilF